MARKYKLLTKSRFVRGRTCAKYVWIAHNEPNRVPEPDPASKHRMEQGTITGEFATKLYPNGIDIPTDDWNKSLELSKELLEKRVPLFEPGYISNDCYGRADILVPVEDDQWDLLEVKGSTKVKEDHLYDIAFQRKVYLESGIKIRKCYLVLINKEFTKNGEINPEEFFIKEDVTNQVELLKEAVEEETNRQLQIIRSEEPGHCECPDDCPIPDICWPNVPHDSVFTLTRGKKKAIELHKQGITILKEVPGDFKLTDKQHIQRECAISGKPHIHKESTKQFLSSLEYPLYYLDFETINSGIPLFDNSTPFQQITFQYSLHVVDKEGAEPKHYEFLAEGQEDPRSAFASSLKEHLGTKGSIVVYNASFEKSCLEKLAQAFPEHKEWIEQALTRLVDLIIPFRSYFCYHPDQRGSSSIKYVLPALTDTSYEGMEIASGDVASITYLSLYLTESRPSEEEAEKTRKALLEYCALDTKAMIDVHKVLVKMVE